MFDFRGRHTNELQIRKNSNISCTHFYTFLLTQEELLKKKSPDEKYVGKIRLDK